ncbi:MAG: serine/threonine-protein kinase, partial [Gemmatimonadales bacterium]
MADLRERLQSGLADRYRVEREIGRGGMATVFLATDVKHGREVALKVLHPELTQTLGSERFLREIQIAARLSHPHILTLHDSGDAGGCLFYAMPYVQGESLRDRLDRERQLPVEDALRIIDEVSEALGYAHQQGVVHRDIKPENILLSDGHAFVADFGIARAIETVGGERLTATGLAIGTPAYMSPEQAMDGGRLDSRSDIYSLGCVLYELLAGGPPFTGPSAQAIMARHAVDPVPRLRTVRSTVPAEVEFAIEKALAKVPADRFATAAAFASALRNGPARRPTSRRAIGVGIAALGIALVAAVAGRKVGRSRGPPVIASAGVIAVLPFTPSATDTALSRLGRDLVFTLAANLNGAGEIRAVDPQTVLAQTDAGNATHSQAQALRLGQHLGAGSVVRGTLVRVGSQVRWDLALISSDSGTPLAQVSTVAPPDSIRALTDSASRTLLRQIWVHGTPPSPSLDAALKTRSLPALKSFLAGENDIVENHWDEAAKAYTEAVAADPTFWLAYWRLWYASVWPGADVDSGLVSVARAHRNELPDRERLLIESCTCVAESLNVAIGLAKQVTERFPDDWFGWMFYADYLTHQGPVLGYTAADARAALGRAVALNPKLVPGWEHLGTMSMGKDSVVSDRALEALNALGWTTEHSLQTGFDFGLLLRLAGRLQGSHGVADRPLLDTVARAIAASDSEGAYLWGANDLQYYGFPGAQVELDRLLLSRGIAKRFVPVYLRSLTRGWAARGAWDSALVATDRVAAAAPGEPAILDQYRWRVFAAWLGAVGPNVPLAARTAATEAVEGLPAGEQAAGDRLTLAWLDGVLASVRHDRRALEAARTAVHQSHSTGAVYVERSLAALSIRLDGAGRVAADSLVAADASGQWNTLNNMTLTLVLAINRLTAADELLAAGDTARAARLLL